MLMADVDLSEFEERIGYTFKDKQLLIRALTHPSYLQQYPGTRSHNQRLEFLGDAVLSLILAEALFQQMPAEREGRLTRDRSALARGGQLATLAQELELANYVYLSDAEEENGGRSKSSINEDALEALIGAIYLDSDLDTTQHTVLGWYGDLEQRINSSQIDHNPKGALQEKLQPHYGNSAIEYRLSNADGPDHRKTFTVEVLICGEVRGTGTGSSKKEAEEVAAREALSTLTES